MKSKRRGFTIIELLIVITVIMLLAGSAAVYVPKFLMKGRETAAINEIRHVHEAQIMYQGDFRRFATSLAELGPPTGGQAGPSGAGLISGDLAQGVKSGYRYELKGGPGVYTITAMPLVYNSDGRRSFYSDQTMIIRDNWGPEPATASSPEVK